MEDQATQQTTHSQKFQNPFASIDWKAMQGRIQSILFRPKTCWEELKREPRTIREMYSQDAMVLAIIPPLAQFLRRVVLGDPEVIGVVTYRWSFFAGFGMAIIEYLMMIIGIFVLAQFLQMFAPKFGGSIEKETATKMALYSLTPGFLGGVFALIPGLSILGFLFFIYTLFLLWHSIPVMSGVGTEKRAHYFGQSLGVTFLVLIVTGLIFFIFSPSPYSVESSAGGEKINLPGGITVDVGEMEKATKQLEKMFPQAK